mmetsp:Transcript_76304/g.212026  ORF Transcript_76304/g.212026 Transcript_76304/m.212026 type:complete len:321 (+) Transcript_76304:359-1321(+)
MRPSLPSSTRHTQTMPSCPRENAMSVWTFENATSITSFSCACHSRHGVIFEYSHRHSFWSIPPEINRLLAENDKHLTESLWPVSTKYGSPVDESQMRMVLSALPLARTVSLGENLTAQTLALCSRTEKHNSNVRSSQTCTALSAEATASNGGWVTPFSLFCLLSCVRYRVCAKSIAQTGCSIRRLLTSRSSPSDASGNSRYLSNRWCVKYRSGSLGFKVTVHSYLRVGTSARTVSERATDRCVVEKMSNRPCFASSKSLIVSGLSTKDETAPAPIQLRPLPSESSALFMPSTWTPLSNSTSAILISRGGSPGALGSLVEK